MSSNLSTDFIQTLQGLFEEYRDEQNAIKCKAYMKHHFDFIGMKTADRRSLTKALIKEQELPDLATVEETVKTLWSMKEREFHHAGVQLLSAYQHYWKPETLHLIEYCLTTNSWWDSVDNLNAECVCVYFKKFPDAIDVSTKWNKNQNLWLQRSSIIFQKGYKHSTDKALLSAHILNCSGSNEFFIQKAIGWALREYAKTNKSWVIDFVANHPLAPLSKREALKHFL